MQSWRSTVRLARQSVVWLGAVKQFNAKQDGTMLMNRCPNCRSDRVVARREAGCLFVIFFFISMGLAIILWPFLPLYATCSACGAKWKA